MPFVLFTVRSPESRQRREMTSLSSLGRHSALAFLMVLLTGLGCGGSDFPTTRIEGKDFLAEFPNDPEFPVLTLHMGTVLGAVRIFGDGRAAIHRYQNLEGWQDLELQLLPGELDEIIRFVGDRGVFEFDSENVEAKLREVGKSLPRSSHPSSATIEIRLAKFRNSDGRVTSDFRHQARITEAGSILARAAHYQEVPELVGLAEAKRRLVLLSNRPDLELTRADHLEPRLPPSWTTAALSSGSSPQILFFTAREVWTLDWVGGNRRRLATAEDLRVAYNQPPSISPDLTTIAYRRVGFGLQLLELSTGWSRKFIAEDKGSHSAVWSPVGDRVAVSAHIGDHRYHVFAVDRDGSNRRLLTDIGAKPLQWSSDGERLYYSAASLRERNIYVVDRDGTNRRAVLPVPSYSFQISPDGRRAAFQARYEPRGKSSSTWLWTARLNRSEGTASRWLSPVRVARGISGFDWSPDSRYLVFTSGRRLGVVRADGRESETLVHVEVGARWPIHANWSPDGNAIVFVKRAMGVLRQGGPEIWIIGRNGSDPRRLAMGTFPHWVGETTPPAW